MSFLQVKPPYLIGLIGATAFAIYAGRFIWKRLQPRVLNLIIYPIKSLKGIEVDSLEITPSGAKYGPFVDRSYIILNDNNLFLTQRVKPKLALIKTRISGSKIILSADGLESISIDVNDDLSNNEIIEFEIWKQSTSGVLCGEEINKWLSDFIGSPAKMVKFIDNMHPYRSAIVEMNGEIQKDPTLPMRYQDSDPIMLMNSASIDDLNTRLASKNIKTSHVNFRPNILAQLNKPYAEDHFKLWTIGDVTFKKAQECSRCTFPTVDPKTGVKNPELEPFTTLKTYRMFDGYETPILGVQLLPLQEGTIKVGDFVEERESQ